MGMDVIGKKPTSEAGKYFGNNNCAWYPLAEYVCELAPEITSNCTYWQSNDGDGLSEVNSSILADILQNEIDSGRTGTYAQQLCSEFEMLPNEPCEVCKGTGARDASPDRATGDPSKISIICILCDGKGHRRPDAEPVFWVQNVQCFANFLRACGGFEIW
jgi:hypothetical protein